MNSCENQQTGNIAGKLHFAPTVETSQWSGPAYLEQDGQGNPVLSNAEPNEISPSYNSDAFDGTGANWQFDLYSTSSSLCSTTKVASGLFSDGVFAEF